MCRGYAWQSVRLQQYLVACYEAVASQYFLVLVVPYYELAAWWSHGVEPVYVAAESGASAGCAEGYFAQPSYFPHGVRAGVCVDYVDVVSAFVRMS